MNSEAQKEWTADDFFYSRFSENHELVHGKIVPTNFLGTFDGYLLAKFNLAISDYVRQNKLGIVVANVGFILARNPDTIRGANLAFISKSRLAQTGITEKFYPYAPNFVAEIASEHRPFESVKERANEFLTAGSDMVWIIRHQRVNQHSEIAVNIFRSDGTASVVEQNNEASSEDVIQGFKLFVPKLLENWLF